MWRVLTARVQENKVDQWDSICVRATDHNFAAALCTKDSLERMAMKKIRKIRELKPEVSSYLNVPTSANSVTDTDYQKPPDREDAKAADPPAENSTPQAEQGRAE